MDLAVREPGQRGRAARDEHLGLVRTGALAQADDLLGEAQRGLGIAARALVVREVRQGAHATTPTRTLRNRAPDTPWPTWPACRRNSGPISSSEYSPET